MATKINEKLNKEIEQIIRELFAQHGEHLSYLRKDVNNLVTAWEENTKQLKEHNGRLTKMEKLVLVYQGASAVVKSVWGFIAVFLVAGVFGVISMNVNLNKLQATFDSHLDNFNYHITQSR